MPVEMEAPEQASAQQEVTPGEEDAEIKAQVREAATAGPLGSGSSASEQPGGPGQDSPLSVSVLTHETEALTGNAGRRVQTPTGRGVRRSSPRAPRSWRTRGLVTPLAAPVSLSVDEVPDSVRLTGCLENELTL